MKTLQTDITYIYNLSSSDEPNRIRYIGKSNTPSIRLKKHVQESKRLNKTYKHRWINKKISQGHEINLKIIKVVELKFWKSAEIFFINSFNTNNDLTNFANGGNGGCPSKYKLSYDETKRWVIDNLTVNSSIEWFKLAKKNKIPNFIPNAPHDVYNKEWISWNEFLDINNKKPSDYRYITLNESKKYVNKNFKVKSKLEWRDLVLNNEIPESIPSRPERYYKNRGWTSWGDFFGTDNTGTQKVNYIKYDDAKKYVQENFKETKTEKSWRELVKNKLIPDFIPGTPQRYYKNKGWINWYDWFGK